MAGEDPHVGTAVAVKFLDPTLAHYLPVEAVELAVSISEYMAAAR